MARFHPLGAAQELQRAFPAQHPRCDYKPIAKDSLANRFAYVDRHLSNRPSLVSDKFTGADACLFTILKWAKFQSIDLKSGANLLKFMAWANAQR